MLSVVLFAAASVSGDIRVFEDTSDVTSVVKPEMRRGGPILASWTHNNPFEGNFDAALSSGSVMSATLTIVADDVDLGDEIAIYYTDGGRESHFLGMLQQMSFADQAQAQAGAGNSLSGHTTVSTFELDPAWIRNGGTFGASTSLRYFVPNSEAEIETATLSIMAAVPAPGAAALGVMGLICVGFVRRRKAE